MIIEVKLEDPSRCRGCRLLHSQVAVHIKVWSCLYFREIIAQSTNKLSNLNPERLYECIDKNGE
jgi:hypothetical protein